VRTKEILRGGKLEQEVLSLLSAGVSRLAKPMQSIGYKQMLMYLQGGLAKGELEEKVFYATCQYAKRQRTWFAKTKPDLWLKSFADQLEWKSVAEKVRGFLTPEQAAEPAE
jgi:tRNA dimethylallyltransferase